MRDDEDLREGARPRPRWTSRISSSACTRGSGHLTPEADYLKLFSCAACSPIWADRMRIRQVPVAVGMPPPIPARRRLLLAAAAGAAWLALLALQALANGVADHGQRLWLDAAGDPCRRPARRWICWPMRPVTASIRRDYDAAGLARFAAAAMGHAATGRCRRPGADQGLRALSGRSANRGRIDPSRARPALPSGSARCLRT